MSANERVNILMVDDQPAKLLSYEVMLGGLGENLIKAGSAKEALEVLLKNDIAVVLMDVSMPELDGFQLAAMIRQHPRFQRTAIIFVSAVHLTDLDQLKGYEHGAVDYISVPVVAELLRAKVRVFAELHRKTRQLETLNRELEQRVLERTEELARKAEMLLYLNTELVGRNQELDAIIHTAPDIISAARLMAPGITSATGFMTLPALPRLQRMVSAGWIMCIRKIKTRPWRTGCAVLNPGQITKRSTASDPETGPIGGSGRAHFQFAMMRKS
jgi:CheY-like chemotaxis protein